MSDETRRALKWIVPVDDQWHRIGGGKVLHVFTRIPGAVEVWTLEQTDAHGLHALDNLRTVRVYGTGHPIAEADVEHIGSTVVGSLVWHVFGEALS